MHCCRLGHYGRLMTLEIRQLHVAREGTPVVKGVTLSLAPGEVVVVRGKNGSGKSSLLNALMGHPKYFVKGSVQLDGEELVTLPPHVRAQRGLFLALQQPPELSGVPLREFVRSAIAEVHGERPADDTALYTALGMLRLDPRFAERSVNEGFSGGEKKRSEIVQLLALRPKYALLDEPDSGLDPAALQYVADAIAALLPTTGFLVVTHNATFIDLLAPDRTLTMADGILHSDYAEPRAV